MSELRRSISRAAVTLCVVMASLSWANRAAAQKPEGRDLNKTLVQSEHVLRERNRGELHHGDPLELVGREQGGNDLRSRTPALAKTDHAAAKVDVDDNYRRVLAMYDTGARFNAPPATTPGAPVTSADAPNRVVQPGVPAEPPVKPRVPWSWPLAFALSALFAFAFRKSLSALLRAAPAKSSSPAGVPASMPKTAAPAPKTVRLTVSP